jgi:hypothetical protein
MTLFTQSFPISMPYLLHYMTLVNRLLLQIVKPGFIKFFLVWYSLIFQAKTALDRLVVISFFIHFNLTNFIEYLNDCKSAANEV